jgi:hypothetical protein
MENAGDVLNRAQPVVAAPQQKSALPQRYSLKSISSLADAAASAVATFVSVGQSAGAAGAKDHLCILTDSGAFIVVHAKSGV